MSPVQFRQKLGAEGLGAFFLVFAGCGAIVVDGVTGGAVTHLGVALTFGLVVMTLVYSVGHISGAHLNPAVTLAFAATGRFPWRCVLPYVAAQCAGAVLAALVLRGMFGDVASLGASLPRGSAIQSLVLEGVLTALLMFVIMAVATDSRAVGSVAGLAIGGVVALEATFAGPICGASMNPARSLGPAVVATDCESLWIYFVGPILGAIVGAFAYRLVRCDDEPSKAIAGCCP